jgi:hypothetical protein
LQQLADLHRKVVGARVFDPQQLELSSFAAVMLVLRERKARAWAHLARRACAMEGLARELQRG